MFSTLNYVTKVELFVIAGILLYALYIAYSLDMFKKG